jgi:hypothetical protein
MSAASSPRAVLPAVDASVREVPAVTQPPQLKPMTIVAIAVTTHAHTSVDFAGW